MNAISNVYTQGTEVHYAIAMPSFGEQALPTSAKWDNGKVRERYKV